MNAAGLVGRVGLGAIADKVLSLQCLQLLPIPYPSSSSLAASTL